MNNIAAVIVAPSSTDLKWNFDLTRDEILNNSVYKILSSVISYEECLKILNKDDSEFDEWFNALKVFAYNVLITDKVKLQVKNQDLYKVRNGMQDSFDMLDDNLKLVSNDKRIESHIKKEILYMQYMHVIIKHVVENSRASLSSMDKIQMVEMFLQVRILPAQLKAYKDFILENLPKASEYVMKSLIDNLTDYERLFNIELKHKNPAIMHEYKVFIKELWQIALNNLQKFDFDQTIMQSKPDAELIYVNSQVIMKKLFQRCYDENKNFNSLL